MLRYWPFKKTYLLVAGSFVLAVASYEFALKHTLEAYTIHRHLAEQQVTGADLAYDQGYLERKSINLDRIIDRYRADTLAFRNNVLNSMAILAEKNQVKLIDVPLQDTSYRRNNYLIQKMSFQGDFFALEHFLNGFEKQNGIGVVRAVEFRTVASRSSTTEVNKLTMELYIELIANNRKAPER